MTDASFRDSMRAQYYIDLIIRNNEELGQLLKNLKNIKLGCSKSSLIASITTQIADELDQIILPCIAQEIAIAKKKNLLNGNNPKERYYSFFIKNGQWTKEAKRIFSKYKFLCTMLEKFTDSSYNNIFKALKRADTDYELIASKIGKRKLLNIKVPASDRHRGGYQTLILEFTNRKKIIYKPVDLTPDELFYEFINTLEIDKKYSLIVPNVSNRKGYGWIEYFPEKECKTVSCIKAYYRRAGTLLAVCDMINYTDGHLDNLIAYGKYPVLIDLETLFQNFSNVDYSTADRSILITGLIEKPIKKGQGFTSAFQALGDFKYEFLYPYPINERTDNLKVRFRGFTEEKSKNLPKLRGKIITPHDFVTDFVEGYSYGYDLIANKRQIILNNKRWWRKLSHTKCRHLARYTIFYALLIRKMQQPRNCTKIENAIKLIEKLLTTDDKKLNILKKYEKIELLNLDIPIFFHKPGSKDLIDGNGRIYKNYFKEDTISEMRRRMATMSESYKRYQIAIIKNLLPKAPKIE